jgi:protease-4
MRNFLFFIIFSIIAISTVEAQSYGSSYFSRTDISATSAGAMRYGLYGYDNPAFLSAFKGNDITIFGNSPIEDSKFSRWGFVTASKGFSFYFNQERESGRRINDYGINFSAGNEGFAIGAGYGWSNGDRSFFARDNFWQVGAFSRPVKYLSLSVLGVFHQSKDMNEGVFSAAVRPFGDEKVSGFFDYILQSENNPVKNRWAAGIAVEPLPGLRAIFRYFEDKTMSAGLQIGLGGVSLFSHSNLRDDGKIGSQTYGLRIGSQDRNFLSVFQKSNVAVQNLYGGLKYQKYKLFDGSNTLIDALRNIEDVKNDDTYKGIILNLSGCNINREMLWELREQLKSLQKTGKKVVIYIDGGGMDLYHFASVADKIVMDPVSAMQLPGYSAGKTYMKGTLEKLGIGFDEWRFFKYKSAMETLSRDKASEADKEQRQALVDDFYDLAKSDILTSRPQLTTTFDDIINNKVLISSRDALKLGLVDTLARYDDLEKIFEGLVNSSISLKSLASSSKKHLPDDNLWGKKNKIAVIYALGACAMDEGITARRLINDVRAAAANSDIKAIVLRVDSPGGDGKASDYIADGLKKYAKYKPVIVSQGSVAASGGYWLSMYADTILAAPNTITGSIGVIGGWYYNKGLSDWTGLTADQVSKGERADLFTGITIPLLGITVPHRNMTPEEKDKIKEFFLSEYESFKGKVATGRKRSVDEIEAIAQGRVWSGIDGLNNGLVDVLGGLNDAIKIAAQKAGLDSYEIVEYPEQPLFDFGSLLGIPKIPSLESSELIKDIKLRLEFNGMPLFLLPDEFIDLTK